MKITLDVDVKVDNSAKAKSDIKAAIKRGLWRIGAAAEGAAVDLCPVDTGRLRNSITHVEGDDCVYIGTNVEYGKYVELGTKNHKPQPFLRPAAQDHADEYKRIMRQELRR